MAAPFAPFTTSIAQRTTNGTGARFATSALSRPRSKHDDDVAKAVAVLVKLYGDKAMVHAKLLERVSQIPNFARSVRRALEGR